MKVLVVETKHPDDFYNEQLDGVSTHQLLKVFGIRSELRIALTQKQFVKALNRASRKKFDVLHFSSHGNEDGIGFAADKDDEPVLKWRAFARLFEESGFGPKALVMSSCCGATSGIEDAFEKIKSRPNIIFGSTSSRYYHDYVVAWAILYRRFKRKGVTRVVAQEALKDICAVVHPTFIYRRWDDDEDCYRHYPREGEYYEVAKRTKQRRASLRS
jgi:hypothetical protein